MTGKSIIWTIVGLGSIAALSFLFFTERLPNPFDFEPQPQEPPKTARQLKIDIAEQNNSGVNAKGVIRETEGGVMFVDIEISETSQTQNIARPARINFGTCESPEGEIYLLGVINGYSGTKLLRLDSFAALFADSPLNLNLRASTQNSEIVVACGDINPGELEVLQ